MTLVVVEGHFMCDGVRSPFCCLLMRQAKRDRRRGLELSTIDRRFEQCGGRENRQDCAKALAANTDSRSADELRRTAPSTHRKKEEQRRATGAWRGGRRRKNWQKKVFKFDYYIMVHDTESGQCWLETGVIHTDHYTLACL